MNNQYGNSIEIPLVTIVVITYNSSNYVVKTLDSIKHQNYSHLELIITDDGSTDNTVDVCQNWLDNNKNKFVSTRLIANKMNNGIPENCNIGCRNATGSWIKLIAGDDKLYPDCITKNIQFINNDNRINLIYSDATKIDENDNIIMNNERFYKNELVGWRNYFFKQTAEKQLKLYARDPIFLISPTVFFSKSLFERIDGFDENLKIFEDIILIFKTLQLKEKIHHFPDKTVYYRVHNKSVSKTKKVQKEKKGLKEFKYIYYQYQKPLLKICNLFDLNTRLRAWLLFVYSERFKGSRFLMKLNVFTLYQKIISAVQE